ncbi:hypothetical protein BDN67DRAFT_224626 [Paxillus ammoniavirescens]|nr:hypothetical protein BDN67DRAFT_224626 [Paxillus ammoniavirescens]
MSVTDLVSRESEGFQGLKRFFKRALESKAAGHTTVCSRYNRGRDDLNHIGTEDLPQRLIGDRHHPQMTTLRMRSPSFINSTGCFLSFDVVVATVVNDLSLTKRRKDIRAKDRRLAAQVLQSTDSTKLEKASAMCQSRHLAPIVVRCVLSGIKPHSLARSNLCWDQNHMYSFPNPRALLSAWNV